MEKIRLFHLADCPYCHEAKRAIAELTAETPSYAKIPVEWVEERRHPEIAEQFDYYYVPTIFCGSKKLYEAHPSETYTEIKSHIRTAFDEILKLNA